MSGPNYPPPPIITPGSNSIGSFKIGWHQVGTIHQFNWWDTVISQYANSPTLTAIIGYTSEWIDQTANFDAFYSDIWNIDTAVGYGLDVWGRILGITRNIAVDSGVAYFSFDIPNRGYDSAANIYIDGQSLIATTQTSLADNDYRKLLLAKAVTNISGGDSTSINAMYGNWLGQYGGLIFLTEQFATRPMTYTVVEAGTAISLNNLAILQKNYLPIGPAASTYDVLVASESGPIFGFDTNNTYIAGFDTGKIAMTPFQYQTTYGFNNFAWSP